MKVNRPYNNRWNRCARRELGKKNFDLLLSLEVEVPTKAEISEVGRSAKLDIYAKQGTLK